MEKHTKTNIIQIREKIMKNSYIIFLLIAMFWSIAIVGKGIDMSDMGYSISKYKYAFENYSSMNIGVFLTTMLGGSIYNILPSYHLLVFKLLNVAFVGSCVLLTFYMFKDLINKNLLAFMLMIVSFLNSGTYSIMTYNSVSMFFLMLSAFFVYKKIESEKYIYPFLTGLAIGLSFLFRFPNILFALLYVVILWNDIIKDKKEHIVKDTLSMFLGGLIGVVLPLTIAVACIGFDGILNSVGGLTKTATSTTDNHGIIQMIINIFRQAISGVRVHIFYCALTSVFLVALVIIFIIKKRNNKKLFTGVTYTLLCCTAIVSSLITLFKYNHYNTTTLILAAFAIPIEIFSIFYFMKKDKIVSLLSLMSICIAITVSIGTDNGILQHLYVIYWLFPCFCYVTYKLCKDVYIKIKNTEKNPTILCFILATLLVLSINTTANVSINSVCMLSGVQYREQKYSSLNYQPNSKELYGVKTNEGHGLVLDGVKEFLSDSKYSKKTVLALNDIPMIFTVIDNKNFLGDTYWADLRSVPQEKIENALNLCKTESDMPIVVIRYLNYDNTPFTKSKKVMMVESFCEKNNYIEAKSEELNGKKLYSIFIPQDVK